MRDEIAVIGSGVGGLAAAARLAKNGYRVSVYEKLDRCGGVANIIEDKGFKFDTGPSLVMMPDFLEEIFQYCGENLNDYLSLKILDQSYKIFYADGTQLNIYRDSERTKEEIEKIERGGSRGFDRFLQEAQGIDSVLRPLFYRCFSAGNMLSPKFWNIAAGLKMNKSYWQVVSKFFKSVKLRYAFTFQSLFVGASPFSAPGFYSIITYLDHRQKIFHSLGGTYQVPLAFRKMAEKFGAKLFYNQAIKNIRKQGSEFILDTERGAVKADKVVVNADYNYTQKYLLGRKLTPRKYSCSAMMIYLGLNRKIKGLGHHNFFFPADWRKNLREVFNTKQFSQDPFFYVYVPTVTDPSLSPAGKETVCILILAPNLENLRDNIEEHRERLRNAVFSRIKDISGQDLKDSLEVEHRFYPHDFRKCYNLYNGATFGFSHNLVQDIFSLPKNYDHYLKGLYYVGGSTQPGSGLPSVIAGSRIVADLL